MCMEWFVFLVRQDKGILYPMRMQGRRPAGQADIVFGQGHPSQLRAGQGPPTVLG